MTTEMSNSVKAEEDSGRAGVGRYLTGLFADGGVESEDCGQITEFEFKLLMGIVAFATFAFGCITHGSLL